MDLLTLRQRINEFYLDSRTKQYPNTILLTDTQYKNFLKEIFKVPDFAEIPDGIIIQSIEGLTIKFSEEIEEPRILRL